MDAYIISISVIQGSEVHSRYMHVAMLPDTGTKAAAKQWLLDNVWDDLQDEFPGRTPSDFRVDYLKMNHLDNL